MVFFRGCLSLRINIHLFLVILTALFQFCGADIHATDTDVAVATKTPSASDQWYTFLDTFYSKLSRYEVQQDKSKYRVPDGKNRDTPYYEKLILQLGLSNSSEYKAVKLIDLTSPQRRELNHILDLTIATDSQIVCQKSDNETLIIKGDYVKFSDFLKTNTICSNYFHSNELKRVYIYALNTIFIDENLHAKGRELNIYVIAPKWQVIDSKTIDLSGSDGEEYKTPAEEGQDGSGGRPGNPGGYFFGVAEEVDGVYLKINVTGGNGGPGQKGGKGMDGKDGAEAAHLRQNEPQCLFFVAYKHVYALDRDGQEDKFDVIALENHRINKPYENERHVCSMRLKGHEGKPPGNGANGGKKGYSGKHGNIDILLFNNNVKVEKILRAGKYGKSGMGGDEGRSSRDGRTIPFTGVSKIKHGISGAKSFDYDNTNWVVNETIPTSSDKSYYAKSGRIGGSTLDANPSRLPEAPRPYEVVNKYKSYLIENLNDSWKNRSLRIFMEQLNEKKDIKELYNTLGLAQELLMLEKDRPSWKKDFDYLPLYQSLLSRVDEYSRRPNSSESKEDIKLLAYVYTAILTTIDAQENHSDIFLMTNPIHYLKALEKDLIRIETLEKAEAKILFVTQKMNSTQAYKNEYKELLSEREKEAKQCRNEIEVEIKNIEKIIDEKVNSTIQSILQKRSEYKIQAEDLKVKMQWKFLCSIIKFVGSFAILLGPIGVAASAAIDTTVGVIESLALDTDKSKINPNEYKAIGDSSQKLIESMKKEDKDRLTKALEQIPGADKAPVELRDLSNEVSSLSARLNSIKNYNDLGDVEKDLVKSLKKKYEELSNKELDVKYEKSLKYVSRAQNALVIGGKAFDAYKIISDNQNEVAKLDKAMEELRDLQIHVRKAMVPALHSMEDGLKKIIDRSKGSRVKIDIASWKIKDCLGEIQYEIKQKLGMFPVHAELNHSLMRLEWAMQTSLQIHQRSVIYEEEKTRADFLADLTSVAAMDINITRSDYQTLISQLEISISSNLVLLEYRTVMSFFKPITFPLGRTFYKATLPVHLQLNENNIGAMLQSAKKNVENYISNYESYNSAIAKVHGCIKTTLFGGEGLYPIYAWTNQGSNGMISALLSQNQILVTADVDHSHGCFDAVKLREIKFILSTENITLQHRINERMQHINFESIHSGESYYRMDGKKYKFTTKSILFSLISDYNTTLSQTHTIKMLEEGSHSLSPFTTWKIKVKLNPNSKVYSENPLADFVDFADQIELHLVGKVFHVDKTNDDCENVFQTDSYYDSIGTSTLETCNIKYKIG